MSGRFVRNLLKPMMFVLVLSAMLLPVARPAHALGQAAKALFAGNEFYAPTQA